MSDAPGSGTTQGGTSGNRTVWIVVAVVAAVVLILAAVFFMRSSEVVVPNIVGMTGVDAAKAVQDAGFTIGEASQVETTAAEPGTIISQDPKAGAKAKKGAAISAVQAISPKAVPIPSVVGKQADTASSEIKDAGFVPVTQETYDNTATAGTVVSQLPAAGTPAAGGSEVGLLVSKGKAPTQPAPVTVPNVTGKTQSDAESAIKAAGLVPVAYKGPSSSVASGKVYGQVPSSGSKVEKGSEVGIFVSTGPAPAAPTAPTTVNVPNIVGKSEADAQSALQSAGLAGVKYTGYSSTVAKGNVIQQLPAAGSKVEKGTQVGYQVSLGKPPTSAPSVKVPNVVGMTSANATKAITDAGLEPIVVEDYNETVAEGKVVAQLPDPGVSLAPGSSVAISVSKGPQPVPTPY